MLDLYKIYQSCSLCPRDCLVDRTKYSNGECGMDMELRIASYGPHFGEEPELVGRFGSGAIFFCGCNLLCCFCQNYHLSHLKTGRKYTIQELADIILGLEEIGCTNINLVTPTHYSASIINAILMAKQNGLNIPVVYNCSGYEKIETLKLLEDVVDIYMPDFKFSTVKISINGNYHRASNIICNAEDYFEIARQAVLEMHKQKGDLVIRNGIAKRGLLIRHLIMPNMIDDTKEIIDFIAGELGVQTYLNLMDQYRPSYKSYEYDVINRMSSEKEIEESTEYAKSKGFTRPEWLYN